MSGKRADLVTPFEPAEPASKWIRGSEGIQGCFLRYGLGTFPDWILRGSRPPNLSSENASPPSRRKGFQSNITRGRERERERSQKGAREMDRHREREREEERGRERDRERERKKRKQKNTK